MGKSVIAQKGPYEINAKKGKRYKWCACGKSKTQPFCDSSHTDEDNQPVFWNCEKDETVWFCGCKQTGNKPFCDDTHETL